VKKSDVDFGCGSGMCTHTHTHSQAPCPRLAHVGLGLAAQREPVPHSQQLGFTGEGGAMATMGLGVARAHTLPWGAEEGYWPFCWSWLHLQMSWNTKIKNNQKKSFNT